MIRRMTLCLFLASVVMVSGCNSISGKVTSMDNSPLAGVKVTLTGGTSPVTITTEDDGSYCFKKLGRGDYILTPLLDGHYFNPKSRNVTMRYLSNTVIDIKASDHFNGWREDIPSGEGRTFTYLHLEGTPYEMGWQHGELMKNEILSFREDARAYFGGVIRKELGIWLDIIGLDAIFDILVKPYLDQGMISEDSLEEMQGLSDATGVRLNEIVIPNIQWELQETMLHCSEFVAMGDATADGRLYHGFNMDTHSQENVALWNKHSLLIFYHPEGKNGFAAVTTPGAVGVFSGINEEGISIGWDNTRIKEEEHPDYEGVFEPYLITIRQALEEASNIDETVEVLTRPYRPLGDILIIADGKTKTASALETFNENHFVRDPDPEDDAIWSANQFNSETMDPFDWDDVNPRYEKYEELLLGGMHGTWNVEKCIKNLLAVSPICRTNANEMSLLYVPQDMEIWISTQSGPACTGLFIGFDLYAELPMPEDDWVDASPE